MDKIRLIKRPGGVEDLAFDVTGNGVKDKYFSNNRMLEVSRINSSHIPVDRNTAEKYSKTKASVSDILKDIRGKISDINSNITDISSMTDDKIVIFSQNSVASEKQAMINSQLKNLGGHNLTFQFPESIDITQDDVIVFSGFRNGKIIIDGKNIVLSDMADIGSLFRFDDCNCNVIVKDITIHHEHSKYGVTVYRCPSVNFENVLFRGSLPGSTAVLFVNSDGIFTNCSFQNDNKSEYQSSEYDNIKGLLDDIITKFNDLAIKTKSMSRHLFDTWFSLSSVVPDGAVILNGALIERADEKYPLFWSECLKRKSQKTIPCCSQTEWDNEVNIHFEMTKDTTYVAGKLYYSKKMVENKEVYELIVFTPGTSVPAFTAYEKKGFGQTGKFVVDEALRTIRLPKITKFISGCEKEEQFGNGSYDQIANIKAFFGGSYNNDFQKEKINNGPFRYNPKYGASNIDADHSYYHDCIYDFDLSLATRTGEEVRPMSVHLLAFMQVK